MVIGRKDPRKNVGERSESSVALRKIVVDKHFTTDWTFTNFSAVILVD